MGAASTDFYENLKLKAIEKIDALKQKPLVWIGMATCGKAAGAVNISEAFKKEIKNKGLDAQVIEAGCMGHCYAEPLAIIAKPGFPPLCYGHLDEDLVKRLVEDFLVNDDPCYEFAMVAIEPNEVFPTFTDFPRGAYEQKIILEHCGFIDPEDIDHYIAKEGYAALAKVLTMPPQKCWQKSRLLISGDAAAQVFRPAASGKHARGKKRVLNL